MTTSARRNAIPVLLIAVGLLGNGVYQIVLHSQHPTILDQDFVRGLGFGVFIGIEILGFALAFREKRCRRRGALGGESPGRPLGD